MADLAPVVPQGRLTALLMQPPSLTAVVDIGVSLTLHRQKRTSVALSALSRANTMALQMSVLDTVRARSRSSNLHAIRG